jgi:hypothetical protein
MKIPEYDNRPGPGEALYSEQSSGGDFKWSTAAIGLAVFWAAFFSFVVLFIISLFS